MTPTRQPYLATWSQSLANGPLGPVLLAIELAHHHQDAWCNVHEQLATATCHPLIGGDQASLFFGVPAVAFTLHNAGPGKYDRALAALHTTVTTLAHRRIDRAHARIDHSGLPHLTEYDLIYGLTGIGVYLLRSSPHDDALGRVLAYLVRLTHPLTVDGDTLPGWWTPHDPSLKDSAAFTGGHGNFGLAHGIAGPLALLALALREGIVVDGHHEAIWRICDWLDTWRQDHAHGPWWPQWITRDELRDGRSHQQGPLRPSWCYGTPGLARAQQLGGIAAGDIARQRMAEQAMAGCLADPDQLAHITDRGLCHGAAGILHTAHRVAHDAPPGTFAHHLPRLHDLLRAQPGNRGSGLLDGATGPSLVLQTATTGGIPATHWDSCLLLA